MKKTLTLLACIAPVIGAQGATLYTIGRTAEATENYSYLDLGFQLNNSVNETTVDDISASADGVAFTFSITLTSANSSENLNYSGNTSTASNEKISSGGSATFNGNGDGVIVTISNITSLDSNFKVNLDSFGGLALGNFQSNQGSRAADQADVNGVVYPTNSIAGPLAGPSFTLTTVTPPTSSHVDGPNQSSTSFSLTKFDVTFSAQAVPEPSTTALLGLGGLALIMRRRK
ncbi:PEP-CTERM sorting domain-containing protein [Rubritalea tangerina]|uniref:PEP-CTERM sorting domain-containing protein n=2 Tax=Rubritalea tangerina TaxID=430798 RepID=A0ABW4ZEK6_9BACT